MNGEELQKLKDLLYSEDNNNIIAEIRNMSPLELHIFAANYNWNSDFDIPEAIFDNGNCDFGTSLLLFYRADGYRVLESSDAVSESSLNAWKKFISCLFDRIVAGDFANKTISFTPPLTKVQVFKLKKSNPDIPEVFLDKSPGNDVEVPVL